jgi:hypothetical protein
VSTTELIGFAVVITMVLAYALEERSTTFILVFALSCLGAAAYAALIRSWPFAFVEALWSLIAFRRWFRRRSSRAVPPDER